MIINFKTLKNEALKYKKYSIAIEELAEEYNIKM